MKLFDLISLSEAKTLQPDGSYIENGDYRDAYSAARARKEKAKKRKVKESDHDHLQAEYETGYWGRRGAGALFLAEDTGRVGLALRSKMVRERQHPDTWGTVGGAANKGEKLRQCLAREVREEINHSLTGAKIDTLDTFENKEHGFRYTTFLVLVSEEFHPEVHDWETAEFRWFDLDELPDNLHPGLHQTLAKPEVQQRIRKMIRWGFKKVSEAVQPNPIKARVQALSVPAQEQLAEALTRHFQDWMTGDAMLSGNTDQFVGPFKLIASVIEHRHRRNLRRLFRGVTVHEVTPDIQAAATPGRHMVTTSGKSLQSWTTKLSIARQFSSWQNADLDDIRSILGRPQSGRIGVLFQSTASALPVLFTVADVRDAIFEITDALDRSVYNKYTGLGHSAFIDLYYDLEKIKGQSEVVVLTPPAGKVPVIQAVRTDKKMTESQYITRPDDLVYHGSKSPAIKNFEFRSGKRAAFFDDYEVKSNGFFFALTPEDAQSFGPYVSAYRITCNRPLISGTEGVDQINDPRRRADLRYILAPLFQPHDDEFMKFEGMINAVFVHKDDMDADPADPDKDWIYNFMGPGGIDWEVLDNAACVQRMRERGYDGTVVYEPHTQAKRSWFVVSPQQITWVKQITPVTEARSPQGDARSFGIWFYRYYEEQTGKSLDGMIINYDYTDDRKGYPLRYRMIVRKPVRDFVRAAQALIEKKGWRITVETKRARGVWQIVFEPEVTSRVSQNGVFWHLTPRANVEAVLRQGLEPRQSRHGFKFPQPRIYLMQSQGDAERMVTVLGRRDPEPIDYVLLRVDLRRVKGVTLHIDPELPEGISVYTRQAIPAAAISLATA